jgi:hypothetical protein
MNHPPRFTPRTLSPAVEPVGGPPGGVYHDDSPRTGLRNVSARVSTARVREDMAGRVVVGRKK